MMWKIVESSKVSVLYIYIDDGSQCKDIFFLYEIFDNKILMSYKL